MLSATSFDVLSAYQLLVLHSSQVSFCLQLPSDMLSADWQLDPG